MAKMTGGQALVQSIKKHGIEVIFGLPGVQLDWAFDALYDERDAIKVYNTRHEQATSYMADGYARASGRVGANLVVPGPGLLNAMAGLSTAYACNSPVLCITGQVQSDQIGSGRGHLHEIPNQLEMVRSATKWSGRAMTPAEVPGLVQEAFRQMFSGRVRPVAIEIPPDVLQTTGDVELVEPAARDRLSGDPDLLEQAARILGQAERPIIFAGGGIIRAEAEEEIRELAEMLQAPVILSANGKGAISARHYLSQNMAVGRHQLAKADVVLVVGTRFLQPPTAGWGPSDGQTVIQLDIDTEEIGRNYSPTLGITADAKLGLSELVNRAGKHNRKRESRETELLAEKERLDDLLFEVQPQASYGMAIREELPDDGIIVADMTQVAYWSHYGMPIYEPRTYIHSGYQGTLGLGLATALGAQVGSPDKKVVSINGDGGFMFTIQELSTAVTHKINAVHIVFADGAYGNVRRYQVHDFNDRVIGSEFVNPDFVKLAESFGIQGRRAEGPEGLRTALREALKSDEPAVIEVPVGEMPSIWSVLKGYR